MNFCYAWKPTEMITTVKLTRAIVILLLLVIFAEQSLSRCAEKDRKEITQGKTSVPLPLETKPGTTPVCR